MLRRHVRIAYLRWDIWMVSSLILPLSAATVRTGGASEHTEQSSVLKEINSLIWIWFASAAAGMRKEIEHK